MYLNRIIGYSIALFPMLQSFTALTNYDVSHLYSYVFLIILIAWFICKKKINYTVLKWLLAISALFISLLISSAINTESYHFSISHLTNLLSVFLMSVLISTSMTRNILDRFVGFYSNILLFIALTLLYFSVTNNGDWRAINESSYGGGYLFLGMYFSIAFAMQLSIVTKEKSKFNQIKLMIFFFACILSLSRSALIYVFIVTIIFSIGYINSRPKRIAYLKKGSLIRGIYSGMFKPSRAKKFAALVAILLLPFVIYIFVPDYIIDKISTHDAIGLDNSRIHILQGYLPQFYTSPIFGHGAGSWHLESPNYMFESNYLSNPGHPHNLFLQLLLDGGIVALLFGVIVIFYPILIALRYRERLNRNKIFDPEFNAVFFSYIICVLEYSKSHEFYTGFSVMIFAAMLITIAKAAKRSH